MKKIFISTLAAVISLASIETLKADVLATWTFQTFATTNGLAGTSATRTGIAADLGSGTASGLHASAATIWSLPTGNGSSASMSSDHWALGDYYQFAVSTIGYSSVTISYDQTGSASGPRDFKLQYSTDGSIFSDFGNYVVLTNSTSANNSGSGFATTGWNSTTAQSAFTKSFDLSSIISLDNNSLATFRVVVASSFSMTGGAIGTGGTDRIDNFTLNATAVPEPATLALATLGGLAGLVALRRKR